MEIKYVSGDILTPDNSEKNQGIVVCHQVNCKGVMGAGLAKQVRVKFPGVYRVYKEKCDAFGSENLGSVQFCSCLCDAGYIIANVFGQDRYGRDKQYTDYNALRKAFRYIAQAFPNDAIRIPYLMGCGLAGGDWNIVLQIINEELVDKGCCVEIWKFN